MLNMRERPYVLQSSSKVIVESTESILHSFCSVYLFNLFTGFLSNQQDDVREMKFDANEHRLLNWIIDLIS
jgi:hypothetical protein